MTLSITDTQHNNALHNNALHYECHYTECRVLSIVVPSVVLNVIMLSVVMLNVVTIQPDRQNWAFLIWMLSLPRFSVPEMKRIYRGFKTECPTGLITEEAFHSIYARFFPNGGTIQKPS
jgi:hypothetical protein